MKKKDIKEYIVLGLLVVLLVFGFYQTSQINEMKSTVKTGETASPSLAQGSGSSPAQAPAPQPQMVGGC